MMQRELLPESIKDKDAKCVETNTPTLQNTQNSEEKQTDVGRRQLLNRKRDISIGRGKEFR